MSAEPFDPRPFWPGRTLAAASERDDSDNTPPVFARGNVRFRWSTAWLDSRRSGNSDLQTAVGQSICRAIGCADLLDSAPDIVRAIEHLHRLVSLRHLLEHGGIVRFAVQHFLKTCERVCRVAAFPEFFTVSQQLINDGWSGGSHRCGWRNAWLRRCWRTR